MYTKYITVIFYALIVSAFLNFGCNSSSFKKESGKDKIKSYNDYFPVNEGPRDETELFKVEITSVKYNGSDLIAELNSFPFFSKQEEKSTLRIKPNGEVYLVNMQTQKDELFIPDTSNFKKEYQWQFGQWSGLIGGTNETVKAENETFNNCIFLNFSIFFTFSAEIWIAKDKGIVKWGYNRTNPPTLKPQYYVLNKLSLAK